MSHTMEDVRRFAGADQGLAVVSFGRPDQSVHSSLVNAGVMAHPVTGEEVVALAVRGATVKLPPLAPYTARHHRLSVRLVVGRRGGHDHHHRTG